MSHGTKGWHFARIFAAEHLRDFERYARTVAAFIHLAMIRIMLVTCDLHIIEINQARPSSQAHAGLALFS